MSALNLILKLVREDESTAFEAIDAANAIADQLSLTPTEIKVTKMEVIITASFTTDPERDKPLTDDNEALNFILDRIDSEGIAPAVSDCVITGGAFDEETEKELL